MLEHQLSIYDKHSSKISVKRANYLMRELHSRCVGSPETMCSHTLGRGSRVGMLPGKK